MHQITTGSTTQSASGGSVKAITAGFLHSMILHEDGSVWVAGANHRGQLGDGPQTGWYKKQVSIFECVVTRGAQAVAAGYFHSMILKRDGSFWATGANDKGELGDGSKIDKGKFARVARANDQGA